MKLSYKYSFLIIALFISSEVFSQTEKKTDASIAPQKKFTEAIEDNSFLLEEAYNQEESVIQHIFGLMKTSTNDYLYSFTEEWPMIGQDHQISFTLPYSSFNEGGTNGIGDILINYRYQLSGHDDWITTSPRLSLILPTGNVDKGLGGGVWGLQFNLPMSKRLNDYFITHINLGFTYLPNSKTNVSNVEIKKDLLSYNYGISLIWLASYNLNFMLEYVGGYNAGFDETGNVNHESVNIFNPGLRYAIDLNNLQIVPGLSIPISSDNGKLKSDLFLYISFEHPL